MPPATSDQTAPNPQQGEERVQLTDVADTLTDLTTHAEVDASPPSTSESLWGSTRMPDTSTVAVVTLAYFWHLPVLGVAYLAHSRFRKLSPRMLPTFTSMKLREVYAAVALSIACGNAGAVAEIEITVANKFANLRAIEQMIRGCAERIRNDPPFRKSLEDVIDTTAWKELTPTFREVLEEGFRRSGLLGRLEWWKDHCRSDERTWLISAFAWLALCHFKVKDKQDFEVCVTHLANTVCSHPDKDFLDYVDRPMIAFAVSVPLAILARRSGIPWLFRSLNGLQRVLVGAMIYFGPAQKYQHYAYLKKIRDPAAMVNIIEESRLKSNPAPDTESASGST
ncbi:hypothetical protein BD414DRAFT_256425 [Trametes punicea]|nr:hypothetical protein BD414DRAFT_256425 [Trametes punicea]